MLEFNCRLTKLGGRVFDLTIKIGDPQRAANGQSLHHECVLQLGDDQPVAIGGVTPIDAAMNALTVAKGFVGAESVDTVEWIDS